MIESQPNTPSAIADFNTTIDPVEEIYRLQRNAYLEKPVCGIEERKNNLIKLEKIILDNQDVIVNAISEDFGNRSANETKLAEIFPSVDMLRYCRKNLKKWMKPQKRSVSVWFKGAKNTVIPQPKGVVAVIVPWNYPLYLCIGPLACAMAAGNRCMVKMARNSSRLCNLLDSLISKEFDKNTLAIIPEVSPSQFTKPAYDHIVFTGSPEVGKTVMEVASKNLVPVTLELGGKSPTIICDDYDMKKAAKRMLFAKYLNAGQTCVAPDYLFIPEAKQEEFITHAKKILKARYKGLSDKSYTSIIDGKAYKRLRDTMDDAVAKGAKLINLFGDAGFNDEEQRVSPHLVVDVDESMTIMKEEIFGPLLPIKTYKSLEDVLVYIQTNHRPLGLYLFTNDSKIQKQIINNTSSGGVAINDCALQAAQHDLPFGGVGNSGMGHYHGTEGFYEFSKLRPVFKQHSVSSLSMLYPPYGRAFNYIYSLMVKGKR